MPSKRILYGVHRSPPVRAVLMTLEALGLDYEFSVIDSHAGEQLKPEFLKKNPQHSLPTLEEEDGKCIWDSHAIMAYLVRKYGKDDSLYPKDYYQRAVVDQRLHYESGVLFMGLGRGKLGKIMQGTATKADLPEFHKSIEEAYDLLEIFLDSHQYIAGNSLTIADFSTVTTISALNSLNPIDASKYPKLSAWNERMKKLPYFESTNADGIKELQGIFDEKLAALN